MDTRQRTESVDIGMSHSQSFVDRVGSALSIKSMTTSMPRVQSNASLGSVPEPIHKVDSLTFLANAVSEYGDHQNGSSKKEMVRSSSGTGLSFLVSSKVKQEKGNIRNSRNSYEKGIDLLEVAGSSVGTGENDSNYSIGLPIGGFGTKSPQSNKKRGPPSPISIPLSIGSISSMQSLTSLVVKREFKSSEDDKGEKQPRRKRQRRSKEESKAKHRMVERRRTKRLNELISALKVEVMDEETRKDKKKSDKVSVLMASLNMIRNLKAELRKLQTGSGGGSPMQL
jgi:hypothetical protein